MRDPESNGARTALSANEKNFIEIVGFLRRHEIDFWLDQGTLLGVVRDGALLPWDKDIDISVWTDGFDRILEHRDEVRRLGYYIEVHEPRDTMFLSKPRGYFIEICRHRVDGDRVVRFGGAPRNSASERRMKRWLLKMPHPIFVRLRHFARKFLGKPPLPFHTPLELLDEFATVRFLGLDVPVPRRAEDYLAFKYGPDWRIPKREWDVAAEDGAVIAGQGNRAR